MAKALTPAFLARARTCAVVKLPSEWVVWRWRSIRSPGLCIAEPMPVLFPGEQAGGEGRPVSAAFFARAFVIVQDPQALGEVQEFVVRQAEFFPARMLIAQVVVDQKGFVEQHAARLEGSQESW